MQDLSKLPLEEYLKRFPTKTKVDIEPINVWLKRGLCHGKFFELEQYFFGSMIKDISIAKKYCTDCPVKDQCSTYALAHDERYGVWGGLSSKQRKNFPQYIIDAIREAYRQAGLLEYRPKSKELQEELRQDETDNFDTDLPMVG